MRSQIAVGLLALGVVVLVVAAAALTLPSVFAATSTAADPVPCRIASFYDQSSAELGIGRGVVDFIGARSHAQTRPRSTRARARLRSPVEFPDGLRGPKTGPGAGRCARQRVSELRFVLDILGALRSGLNPDLVQRPTEL